MCRICNVKRYTRASNLYRHQRTCEGSGSSSANEDRDHNIDDDAIAEDSEDYSQSPSSPLSEVSGPSPLYSTPFNNASLPDLSNALIDATSQAHWGSVTSWKPTRRFSTSSVLQSSAGPASLTIKDNSSKVVSEPLPIAQRFYYDRSKAPKFPTSNSASTRAEWESALTQLADLALQSSPAPSSTTSRDDQEIEAPSGSTQTVVRAVENERSSRGEQSPPTVVGPAASQASQRRQGPLSDPLNWVPVSHYLAPYFDSSSTRPSTSGPLSTLDPTDDPTPTQERTEFIRSDEVATYREGGQSTTVLPVASVQPRGVNDPQPMLVMPTMVTTIGRGDGSPVNSSQGYETYQQMINDSMAIDELNNASGSIWGSYGQDGTHQ